MTGNHLKGGYKRRLVHIWVVGGVAMAEFPQDRTFTVFDLERVIKKMKVANRSRLMWLETGMPKGLPVTDS